MGLLPTPKPTGNAAPEAAQEGLPNDPAKFLEEGAPNVSPEEQAEYEAFMNNAYELLYHDGEEGGEPRPEVIEQLRVEGEDERAPIMALAQAAVTIVSQLDDSARGAGSPVSDDVLQQGGLDVITDLASIAEVEGIYDYTEEQITGAYVQAVDMYRSKAIQDGRTSEETLKGQFAELNEAEAAGKLGDVLPGLGPSTVGSPPVQAEG